MANYTVTDTQLSSIADAIRTKGGTSETLSFPDGFVSAIDNMTTSGGDYDIASIAQRSFFSDPSLLYLISGSATYISNYAFCLWDKISGASYPECSFIGSHAFSSCLSLSYISFPKCKSIAAFAFQLCTNLTSVYLPSCSNVGYGAFSGCFNLSQIDLPGTFALYNYAFYNCSKLTSISIPVCISIYASCFYAAGLTSIEGPAVTGIAQYAFAGCSWLTYASFPYCTSVGSSAFSACHRLQSINLDKCKYIGPSVFHNCSSLEYISLPKVETLFAFSGCSKLSMIDSLSVCGNITGVFYYCPSLRSIVAPACSQFGGIGSTCTMLSYLELGSVTLLSSCSNTYLQVVKCSSCNQLLSSTFLGCSYLSSVSLPGLRHLGGYAFNGCSSLTYVSFSQCTSIPAGCFRNCINLESVSIPECTSIVGSAFVGCNKLQSGFFPKCSYIAGHAFNGANSLSAVTLGASSTTVTSGTILISAFVNCWNLLSLYLLDVLFSTVSNVFTNTPINGYTTTTGGVYGSVFVPESLYDSYLTATYWSTIPARIVSLTSAQQEYVRSHGTHIMS